MGRTATFRVVTGLRRAAGLQGLARLQALSCAQFVSGSRDTHDSKESAPRRGRACGSVACEMMEQTLSSWPVRQCTCILSGAAHGQGDTARSTAEIPFIWSAQGPSTWTARRARSVRGPSSIISRSRTVFLFLYSPNPLHAITKTLPLRRQKTRSQILTGRHVS